MRRGPSPKEKFKSVEIITKELDIVIKIAARIAVGLAIRLTVGVPGLSRK